MSRTTYTLPHNLFSVPDITPEVNRDQVSGWEDIKVLVPPQHSHFVAHELIHTAIALASKGKGIYATDEAPDDMDRLLFAAAGIDPKTVRISQEALQEKRKRWREVVYEAAPPEYISGVIMHSETLLDFKLATMLSDKGIIPGVRANGELAPIPLSEHEFIVQGIDDLLSKLQAARGAGARFSKWRAPIACSSLKAGYPTQISLEIQAESLAQFAAISQQAGLVPIIEPDVDFSRDADLDRSAKVHEKAIAMIYERMRAHGVLLEGSLIKPSFPQPGLKCPTRDKVTPEDIALATATILSRTVPPAVPGIMFLSGGMPPATAIEYLSAVNAIVLTSAPTSPFTRLPALTFSFGRAIQGEAMKLWAKGDDAGAKAKIIEMSKGCSQAARGIVL